MLCVRSYIQPEVYERKDFATDLEASIFTHELIKEKKFQAPRVFYKNLNISNLTFKYDFKKQTSCPYKNILLL